MKTKQLIIVMLALVVTSCSDKFKEVPTEKFLGQWELKGRGMFDGIQIKIENQNNKLIGKIVKINNNKLVKMFAEIGDVWVSEISRSSNYQFKLTEKKIAKDLFSLYGLSASQEFKIEFIDDNTIGLGADGSNPQNSKIIYQRVH